jgi:acetylglutamate kinase
MLPAQKARILAEALPYIRAFHGKTLVIRLGGRAMVDPALKSGFARDVALLRLVGMKPVVVHGGGWRIDEMLRQTGIEPRRGRLRVTDERTLTMVEMVLSEQNQELAGLPSTATAAAPSAGRTGRALHPRAAHHERGRRHGCGRRRPTSARSSIDPALIELLLSRNFTPIVMPIGVGADGTSYHLSSDLLAAHLARTLRAEKLILTNVDGVRGRDGKLVYILGAAEADALVRDDVVQGGMRPRLTAALDAVRNGVRSVHIIDGGVPSALLLEVLTAEGVGTALRSASGPEFFADSRAYLLAQ